MILCDPPRWPAHGRLYGHLVSDTSLLELHLFAQHIGLSWRAFDHDHYDLSEHHLPAAVEAGAQQVSDRELLRRLTSAGLRVRQPDKLPSAATVVPEVRRRWDELGLGPAAEPLREDLVRRWQEPHRHYHDLRHLGLMLHSLDRLTDHPAPLTVHLAAWFHDAVYTGVAGADERQSAELASTELSGLLTDDQVAEVARLVLVTIDHSPSPDDLDGAMLSDADLAVLGQTPGRYDVYVRDVRTDYAHVSAPDWAIGRTKVIDHLLALNPLYRTARGQHLWAEQAVSNLTAERQRWAAHRQAG